MPAARRKSPAATNSFNDTVPGISRGPAKTANARQSGSLASRGNWDAKRRRSPAASSKAKAARASEDKLLIKSAGAHKAFCFKLSGAVWSTLEELARRRDMIWSRA